MTEIRANDLRIGNWVKYHSKFEKVILIDGDGYIGLHESEVIPESALGLKYIPLTEEILLKAGFIKKGDWYFLDILCLGYITRDDVLQTEIKTSLNIDKWVVIDIKYLHQLQNLYFALTGEELKIEL